MLASMMAMLCARFGATRSMVCGFALVEAFLGSGSVICTTFSGLRHICRIKTWDDWFYNETALQRLPTRKSFSTSSISKSTLGSPSR